MVEINHQWSFMLLGAFIVALTFVVKRLQRRRNLKLPPGPRKLPIIGNLHHIGHPLAYSLQRLAEQHGPLMALKLGTVQAIVVSSPLVVREILKAHDIVFSGKPPLQALKRLSYDFSDMFAAPYSEYWRQVRKIAILELFSIKRVSSFRSVRMEEVSRVCETVGSAERGTVNVSQLMHSLANNVICRVAFGQRDYHNYDFYSLLHNLERVIGDVNIADFIPWLGWINRFNGFGDLMEKVFKDLDRFYDELIEQHREQRSRPRVDSGHKDLVDVLLEVQADHNQALVLSKDQIKGILLDVLIGGTDTSSTTLVWAMTELIKYPTTMEALQAEVTRVAKGKDMIEESNLPELHYLHMVLKETFRLHPPLPIIMRETIADCKLQGYEIPARTMVFINAKVMGRDPSTWEDPDSFKPERFLSSLIDFRGHDPELIPFGIGRRGCPAPNLATPLMELALANLLYRFHWSLPQGMSPEDIDMAEGVGLATHKKVPLTLVANPRIR
ncbi:Cytochrome P450 71A9-like protein [Drosera capensis]